jgi:hypothetical protein
VHFLLLLINDLFLHKNLEAYSKIFEDYNLKVIERFYEQELDLEDDWYKIAEENQELLSSILVEKSLINPKSFTFAVILNFTLAFNLITIIQGNLLQRKLL